MPGLEMQVDVVVGWESVVLGLAQSFVHSTRAHAGQEVHAALLGHQQAKDLGAAFVDQIDPAGG